MLGNFTNKSDVSATAMCTYGTLATGCGFEKRTTATATTEVHYIQAEGRKVAVHSSPSSTEDETRYLHGDHLGSVVLVTDEDGNVEGERYSFDAFGRRRHGSDWTNTLTALANPDTTLGYTGHESIDAVDIVHMNGRVYDPFLGRVLSADPIVQAPHNGQSLNRYSYVMNNPLSYTDPSGYEWDWWGMDDDYCSVRCYVNSIFSGGFRRPRGGYGSGGSVAVVYYANVADADSEMDTNGVTSMEALRAMAELIRKAWKEIYRDSTRRTMQGPAAAVFGAISGVEDLGEALIGAVEGDVAGGAILGATSRIPGGGAIRRVVGKGTARGRAAEPRVLDDLGLEKNNRRVSTNEGSSIPDSLTTDQSIEIKDCITVSCTRQVRIQTGAAKACGWESVLVTGKNTHVTKPAADAFDQIIRRSDLGPQ